MATSRFSFPVVNGRGLPATLFPTPVSSVRASLRCPLASGCWPLRGTYQDSPLSGSIETQNCYIIKSSGSLIQGD